MTLEARDGLIVRRDERQDVRMRALISVPRLDDEVLRFSDSAPVGPAGVDAVLVDIGKGGLGFESDVFFPRGAIIDVSITDPDGNGALLSSRAIVRRTSMIDRTPSYATGVQFVDPDQKTLETVERLSAGGLA